MKDWATLTTVEEMEAATNELLETASKVGADTWQHVPDSPKPQWGV